MREVGLVALCMKETKRAYRPSDPPPQASDFQKIQKFFSSKESREYENFLCKCHCDDYGRY